MTPQIETEIQSSSSDEPDGTSTLNILDGEPRTAIPKDLATEIGLWGGDDIDHQVGEIDRQIAFFPKLNRDRFVVECIVGGLDSPHANQRQGAIEDFSKLNEEKGWDGFQTLLRWPTKLARTLGLYQLAERDDTRIEYYLTESGRFEVHFNSALKPWLGGSVGNSQLKPDGRSLDTVYRSFQSPEGGEGLERGRYRLEFPQEWAEAYDFERGDTVAFHIAVRSGEYVVAIDHEPEFTDNKQTGRIQQYYPDNEGSKGGRLQYAVDIPRQVVHAFGLGGEIFDLEVTPEPGVIIVGRGDAVCPECDEAFDTVGDIEIHLDTVHGIERELRVPRSVNVV
jgi:bifunctional DNA-binding transcriptional regulator/antitoxin component of YhaV-PrlF toxin-antitoxin module